MNSRVSNIQVCNVLVNARQERPFGFMLAALLLAVGVWRLYGGGHGGLLVAAAVGIVVMTALFPWLWRPVLRVWMPIVHTLGWINTRLLLGIVFFILIAPIGVVMRLFGRDPLRLRSGKEGQWVERGKEWTPSSFKEPF